MLKIKKILHVALWAFVTCSTVISVNAQTNSPYSRYGLGTLKDQATGPSKGMGGVGYGLHTSQSANPMNPASYAQVDSLTFIYDMGITYNNTSYKEGINSTSKSNGGLDYITVLFPVSRKIGISFGLLPYSSTGYRLGTQATASDDEGNNINYNVQHDGSGGLSSVYLGLGYKLPIKGLTAGFNASYLYGNIRQSNITTYITGGADLVSEYSRLNVTMAKIDLGLQYRIELKERSSLTLGAVYTPKMNGTGKLVKSQFVTNSSSSSVTKETIIHDGVINTGTPHTLGVGFIYNHKRRLLFGTDITYQHWKGAKFSNEIADDLSNKERFNNKWKIAAGVEYRIAEYSKRFLHKIKFRGGVNYSNSYVNVNTANKTPKGYNEYGATLGFGLPIADREDLGGRTSYININFEYKYLQPELSSMVKERFFGVSLNMNINELWFYQRKIR